MIGPILGSFVLLAFAINFILEKKKKKKKIYNKKVLVIGGSSGLGYSIAQTLAKQSNEVFATSRNISFINDKNSNAYVKFFHCDVLDTNTFEKRTTVYDVIFYCTGLAIPKEFTDASVNDFRLCYETNFMGMIKILKHYSLVNKRPFDFIMIGSTLSNFDLQGYATYSPTKSAMLSFFYSSYDEFKKSNIIFHFFCPANMNTRGFLIENITKPKFTKTIESIQSVYDPDACAEYFIKYFMTRKVVTMDWFSYLWQIRFNCEKPIDYILFPLATVVVFLTRVFCFLAYKFIG